MYLNVDVQPNKCNFLTSVSEIYLIYNVTESKHNQYFTVLAGWVETSYNSFIWSQVAQVTGHKSKGSWGD